MARRGRMGTDDQGTLGVQKQTGRSKNQKRRKEDRIRRKK